MSGQKPSGRDRLTLILILATISLSAYAAATTINYYEFYPALSKIRVSVNSLHWDASPTSLNGTAVFDVLNPTTYRGMRLNVLQSIVAVVLNSTAIPQGSFSPVSSVGDLDPGKIMTLPVSFQGSLEVPGRVYETQNRGEEVKFEFTVNLTLASFIDKAAIIVVSFLCESTGNPADCQENFIAIYPRRSGISSGGGGGA